MLKEKLAFFVSFKVVPCDSQNDGNPLYRGANELIGNMGACPV
jgi:hypothetical protein